MPSAWGNTITGLGSTYDNEGLLWVEPQASAQLAFWHLYIDAEQIYAGARTGGVTPPGSWPGDPYWIGKWVDAGYAIMVDQDSAWYGPPYRLFLTPDPWYVAMLANSVVEPPYYGIVDCPPELAQAASKQLGYRRATGYGLVEKSGGAVTFPSVPQLPGVPTLPTIPDLSGGYQPQVAPEPAADVRSEPGAPSVVAAKPPPWFLPAAGASCGLALLWYLRRTGRL